MAPHARRVIVTLVTAVTVVSLGAGQLTSSDAAGVKWHIGSALSLRPPATPKAKVAPKPTATSTHPSTPAPAPTTTSTSSTSTTTAPSTTTSSAAPTTTPTTTASPQTPAAPFLGTLVTHGNTAATESAGGVKMAMMEFSWQSYEPSQGTFNTAYGNSQLALLRQYQAAGMKVTLGLGLHYTPQWALNMAGSRMVDEYGNVSSQLDLVFNQSMRNLAEQYLTAVNKAVGLSNFWAIRITSGGLSELLYPSNNYWAYSSGAQNGATMPPGMARNPMPGWKPGQLATAAQRQAWAQWYLGALDNVADWQMSTVASLGFHGYFQIVTPGQGLRPSQYLSLVTNGLTDGLLGRGAVWDVVYAGLQHRTNVTAYISSVGDGAGNDDTCASSDTSVPLTSSAVFQWSSPRWIARIARQNGFTVAGEVPGYPSSPAAQAHYTDPSSAGLMAHAEAQARTCGFLGLYWAHDDQLWNGTIPLSQFMSWAPAAAAVPANAPTS